MPGARAFAEATALLDEVELVILAVPDDALVGLGRSLRLYSGQAMIHTSGALGADVLDPARAAGTQVGSFHPLVAFADPELAVEALADSTIAIEGDDQLASLLADMAEAIGGTAVRLAPGTKSAYHAAAVLAAGGFIALLDAIAELGAVAGLDERGSLDIYGRLAEQALGNARSLGLARALTGPIVRGDVGTLTIAELGAVAGLDEQGSLDIYGRLAEQALGNARSLGLVRALTGPIVRGDVGTLADHLATLRAHAPERSRCMSPRRAARSTSWNGGACSHRMSSKRCATALAADA